MAGDPDAPTPQQGQEVVRGPVTSGPRMRAWAPRDVLEHIDEYRPGAAEQVRRAVPWASWEALEDCKRLEWISIRDGREIPAAVWRVLGHDEAYQFFRWLLPREANRPVIRGILRTSIKLFGLSPASFVRATRGAWGLAFQEVGEPVVDFPSAREGIFALRGLPGVALDDPAFLLSIAGSLQGIFDLCSVEGGVELDVDGKLARFKLAW